MLDTRPEEERLSRDSLGGIVLFVWVDDNPNVADEVDWMPEQVGDVLFGDGQGVDVHDDGFEAEDLLRSDVSRWLS